MRFLKLAILVFGLLTAAMGYFFFVDNPRMRVQPAIKPYQAKMPLPPSKSVPTTQTGEPLPTTQRAARMRSPIAAMPENLAAGKVYYGYYCVSCHGENADGLGPVGEGFLPVPANLRSAKIQGYSDGLLLRAMLTGPGHSPLRADAAEQRPVLEYIVPADHRWPLVLYVKSLGTPK